MSEVILRVYLVRHGETNENKQGIIQGQLDTVLNEDGHHQARLCGEALKNIKFARAFSSDLTRTVQTATAILVHHPNVVLDANATLRERYMGKVQGLRAGTYDRALLMQTAEGPDVFRQRIARWWRDNIIAHLSSTQLQGESEPQNILIVSHGAYISSLCHMLIELQQIDAPADLRWDWCFNTSVTTIDLRRDVRGTLVKYADISHLVESTEFDENEVVFANADEQPEANINVNPQ